MDCKRLEVLLLGNNKYKAEEENQNTYAVDEIGKNKFKLCYCIRYKPVGSDEWILVRGRWNDYGIWTADGIFNDGII